MNRKKILIIPAPIRSHIIPSCNFINTLGNDYDFYWGVPEEHANNLKNYTNIEILTSERVISMYCFDKYEYYIGKLVHFFQNTFNIYNIYRKRKKELKELVLKINPDIILIDIFSSTDIFLLYHLGKKIVTFSPMLSVYDDLNITSRKMSFLELSIYDTISRINKINKISRKIICHSIIQFDGINEFVLAPKEIDCFSVKKEFQTYSGLCINEKLDDEESVFMSNLNKSNKRVIYCSFGIYYTSSNEFNIIISFLDNFIKALSNKVDVVVIIVVNNIILDLVKTAFKPNENFHIFDYVPQLNVLKHCDLFITHGGLGSIKEAIFYEVPMIVYPLDYEWDQPKNANIVQTLEIGIQRNLKDVSNEQISSDIELMLNSNEYKLNIKLLNDKISNKYHNNSLEPQNGFNS